MSGLIGQSLGQYELIALLGAGGMATVYRARQLNIKREVAVKVIKPDLAGQGDFIQRFQREAETVASLSHPHILKLFDYGQSGDLLYLVTELLTGGSLADLLRGGSLAMADILRLADQVASALDYAHKRGIVHRDLKPHNILLDADGNAFLTDFGIAKLLTENTALTQSGAAVGTPAYMAPEQWQGQGVDARTDVYALGIILFEMLLGKLPFQADTPYSMMHQHVNEPPPSIARLRDGTPPQLDSVIARALSKTPQDRYASASSLVAAFKAALDESPAGPTPHSAPGEDQNTLSATTVPSTPQGETQSTFILSTPAPKRPARLPLVLAVIVVAAVIVIAGLALNAPQNVHLANSPTGLVQGAALPTTTVDCLTQVQTLNAMQTAISQSTQESASYRASFAALRQTLTAMPLH